MAIAAHETGVLAFGQYDPAAVACEHLDDQQATQISGSGATCTAAALAWALKRTLLSTLRAAAERADVETFQAALDAVRPGFLSGDVLSWATVRFGARICIAAHCLGAPFRHPMKSAERAAAYRNMVPCWCRACRG
ncbi:hypothetical protein pneo_cds_1055 [Pandoravirus neocaledonia]|uniref:Uncharacterized protein n=1 Tax=Pandoravirus neocaledonia TaxID=2107708 RepID=A0A2U7UE26_9VIRU|nr:hypothetical protein pneo_cds_1055 [Pandoravirus neocaledonia]AVK76662.1 hypothetical protein pneo_cds_1055 [Pandoravirus neocaledonia]